MLVIEIDGPIHNAQQTRDAMRDKFLQQQGFTILRFTNDEVLHDLEKVLMKIKYFTPLSCIGKGLGDRCGRG